MLKYLVSLSTWCSGGEVKETIIVISDAHSAGIRAQFSLKRCACILYVICKFLALSNKLHMALPRGNAVGTLAIRGNLREDKGT